MQVAMIKKQSIVLSSFDIYEIQWWPTQQDITKDTVVTLIHLLLCRSLYSVYDLTTLFLFYTSEFYTSQLPSSDVSLKQVFSGSVLFNEFNGVEVTLCVIVDSLVFNNGHHWINCFLSVPQKQFISSYPSTSAELWNTAWPNIERT